MLGPYEQGQDGDQQNNRRDPVADALPFVAPGPSRHQFIGVEKILLDRLQVLVGRRLIEIATANYERLGTPARSVPFACLPSETLPPLDVRFVVIQPIVEPLPISREGLVRQLDGAACCKES